MTKRAYQIPTNIDVTSLPFVFDDDRILFVDGDYVEVDGSISDYPEVPLRATGAVEVPEYVDARQFFLQLEIDGLTTAVASIVNAAAPEVKISFDKSVRFYRNNPILLQLAPLLNKSPADLDTFFISARLR